MPIALARAITAQGYSAVHVSDLGAVGCDDLDIWAMAAHRGDVVVSKDADFADIVIATGTRQAAVWLRLGNTRKQHLLARMTAVLPEIVAALDAGETLVEVR